MTESEPVLYTVNITNAKVTGKRFTARLLEPGPVSYRNEGMGVALLKKDTIDRYKDSFIGCPLVPRHNAYKKTEHSKFVAENGAIDKVYYNSEDGWFWCEGTVLSDTIRRRIQNSGKVSCGYIGRSAKNSRGEWHGIPYDEEIKHFSGEHLAVEDNPRYEDATIRLNSKQHTHQNMSMFKWFKKSVAPKQSDDEIAAAAAAQKAKDEEAAKTLLNSKKPEDIDGSTKFIIGEGDAAQEVTLDELTTAYTERNNSKDSGEIPADATVDIGDGVMVSVADLVTAEKTRRENAKPDPVPAGSGVFRIVTAASRHEAAPSKTSGAIDTQEERIARGKRLY